ncbi:MAG: prolipoprotein diacylglyceryl transferase, partial [Gammaproteobacteria bacterium]|nr:prolipoprotein diacylglyceryl transferase [Gammaproteobacteria bacterium]
LLEGVLLFVVLWLYSAKPRPRMAVSGMFLLGYGAFRVFCEFFRQPDPQLGFLAGGWLTMGELLSIPMILGGILLLVLAYRYKARE